MDERDMEEEGNDRGEGWRIGIKNVSMYCGIRKPVGQIKHLLCYNFLIFYPILINNMSNKIVLNGLQFEFIQYLFLSSVFDK
jgi:hypothetical protein